MALPSWWTNHSIPGLVYPTVTMTLLWFEIQFLKMAEQSDQWEGRLGAFSCQSRSWADWYNCKNWQANINSSVTEQRMCWWLYQHTQDSVAMNIFLVANGISAHWFHKTCSSIQRGNSCPERQSQFVNIETFFSRKFISEWDNNAPTKN